MFVIGLIILAAAVVFGADELIANNPVGLPDPQVFGQQLGITSGRGLFLIGAATGAAVVLGLALLSGGARRSATRSRDRRLERRQLEEQAAERERLLSENRGLRNRLGERAVDGERPVAGERPVMGERTTQVPVEGNAVEPARTTERL